MSKGSEQHSPIDTDTARRPATPNRWRSGGAGLGLWAIAATVSGLGDSVQAFALSWEASGFGPGAAALVATLEILPRVLLMLFGGVAADRYGIRRVMISCDAAMIIVLGLATGYLLARPADLPVIIAISVIAGVVSAFYLPASGGFVRLFVPAERLPQMMARISSLQQIARLVGPSLGAVLVIIVALLGVSMINLASYAAILVVLAVVRPPIKLNADPGVQPTKITAVFSELADGIRSALRTEGMVAALGSLTLVAGGILPTLYLCLPLLVRQRRWGVSAAGTIESCWIVGTLAVTLVIAKWGVHRRTGPMIAAGPLIAGSGALLIAIGGTVPIAGGGAVLMGVGTAVYTGHLSPLFLAWTPPHLTARFQSLYGIVQAAPMLLMNPIFGLITSALSASAALCVAAAVCLAATAVALSSRRLRSSRAAV